MFDWKTISLISFLIGAALGFVIFAPTESSPIILHAAFILDVAVFLASILFGVRGRIERWTHDIHFPVRSTHDHPGESQATSESRDVGSV